VLEKFYAREFKYSGTSFEEAVGDAEPLHDAVGRIAMNFAALEDEISSGIIYLLRTTSEKGLLITGEMSYHAKVNVMASLMRMEYKTGAITAQVPEEDFNDLIYMCQKSEELRNRLLHSSWVYDHAKKEVRRRKLSAKTNKGFVHDEEPLTPGKVLDIADYVIYTAGSIEEFFTITYDDYKSLLPHVVYA
jgi:hypothetical protein